MCFVLFCFVLFLFCFAFCFVLFCFLIKRQNCERNVRNFRQFFFGMSPDTQTFKVFIFVFANDCKKF